MREHEEEKQQEGPKLWGTTCVYILTSVSYLPLNSQNRRTKHLILLCCGAFNCWTRQLALFIVANWSVTSPLMPVMLSKKDTTVSKITISSYTSADVNLFTRTVFHIQCFFVQNLRCSQNTKNSQVTLAQCGQGLSLQCVKRRSHLRINLNQLKDPEKQSLKSVAHLTS